MRLLVLTFIFLFSVPTAYSQKKNSFPKKGTSVNYTIHVIPSRYSGDPIRVDFNVEVTEASKNVVEHTVKLLKFDIEGKQLDLYNPDKEAMRDWEELKVIKDIRIILRSEKGKAFDTQITGLPQEMGGEFREIQEVLSSNDLFLNFHVPQEKLRTGDTWENVQQIKIDNDSIEITSKTEALELTKVGRVIKKTATVKDLERESRDPLGLFQYTNYRDTDQLMDWQVNLLTESIEEVYELKDMVGLVLVRTNDEEGLKRVKALQQLLSSDQLSLNDEVGNWELKPSTIEIETATQEPYFKEWFFEKDDSKILENLKDDLENSFYSISSTSYDSPTDELNIHFSGIDRNGIYPNFVLYKDIALELELEDGTVLKPSLTLSELGQKMLELTETDDVFFIMNELLETVEFPEGYSSSALKNVRVSVNLEKPTSLENTVVTSADIGKEIPTKYGYVKLLRLENDFAEYEIQGGFKLLALNTDNVLLEDKETAYTLNITDGEVKEEAIFSTVIEGLIVNPPLLPIHHIKVKKKGVIDRLVSSKVSTATTEAFEFEVKPFPDFLDGDAEIPEILHNKINYITSPYKAKYDYKSISKEELIQALSIDTLINQGYYYPNSTYMLNFPRAANSTFAKVRLVNGKTKRDNSITLNTYDYNKSHASWELHVAETSSSVNPLSLGWSGKLEVDYPTKVILKRSSVNELPEQISLETKHSIRIHCTNCVDDIKVFNAKGEELKQLEGTELSVAEEQIFAADADSFVQYYWGTIATVEYPLVIERETIVLDVDFDPVGDSPESRKVLPEEFRVDGIQE